MLILIPFGIAKFLLTVYLVPEAVRWQIGAAEMWAAFLEAE